MFSPWISSENSQHRIGRTTSSSDAVAVEGGVVQVRSSPAAHSFPVLFSRTQHIKVGGLASLSEIAENYSHMVFQGSKTNAQQKKLNVRLNLINVGVSYAHFKVRIRKGQCTLGKEVRCFEKRSVLSLVSKQQKHRNGVVTTIAWVKCKESTVFSSAD